MHDKYRLFNFFYLSLAYIKNIKNNKGLEYFYIALLNINFQKTKQHFCCPKIKCDNHILNLCLKNS